MDNGSFEKMDREFLEGLKNVREKKVPDALRQNFKRSVEQRLLAGGRPAGFGLSFAALPVLVLALGLGLCWFYLRPNRSMEKGPQNIQVEQELQKKEIVPQTIPVPEAVPALPKVPAEIKVQAAAQELSQVTEGNLVAELEALKELGVWTDKDEEEIGIPSEQIFEELEAMAGEILTGGNTSGVPQTSPQG